MTLAVTLGSLPLTGQNFIVDADETRWAMPQTTAEFAAWTSDRRDPSMFSGTRHENVEHVITVVLKPSSTYTLVQLLEMLDAAATPGTTLPVTFGSTTRWTRVLFVDTEQPIIRETHAVVSLTLTCGPYWHAAKKMESFITSTGKGVPAVSTDLPAVSGSVPALSRYRVGPSLSTTMLMLGLRPNYPTGYGVLSTGPVQDYSGGAMANAYGTEVLPASVGTSWTPMSSARSYEADYNGPFVIPVVRASTTAAMQVRVAGKVTASGIAVDTYRYGDPVAVNGALTCLQMGTMPMPPAQVPAMEGGDFAQANTVVANGGSQNASVELTGDVPNTIYGQTFEVSNSTMLGFTQLWCSCANWTQQFSVDCAVWEYDPGTNQLVSLVDAANLTVTGSFTAQLKRFDFLYGGVCQPGKRYVLLFFKSGAGGNFYLYHNTTSTYAGGARVSATQRSVGATLTLFSTHDLYFNVYGRVKLSFVTSMGIEFKSDSGTNTASLDVVTLVPCGWGAVAVARSSGPSYGFLLDLLSDNPALWNVYLSYTAGSSYGTGPSLLGSAAMYGPPMLLQPGLNALVLAGAYGSTVNPSGVSVYWDVEWVERYLYPQGDE